MSAKSKQQTQPKTEPKFSFPDPLDTLADLMFGEVFDGPENPKAPKVKAPPKDDNATDDSDDETGDETDTKSAKKRQRESGENSTTVRDEKHQSFTFKFDGLFGGKSPAPGGTEKTRKTTRKQEPTEDDGDESDE